MREIAWTETPVDIQTKRNLANYSGEQNATPSPIQPFAIICR